MSLKKRLHIAEPCEKVDWNPRARTQHCEHCQHDVVNLSLLTKREVKRRLRAGELSCVSYWLTPEGGPVFAKPPKKKQAALLAGSMMLAACQSQDESVTTQLKPEVEEIEQALPLLETAHEPDAEPVDAPSVEPPDVDDAPEPCESTDIGRAAHVPPRGIPRDAQFILGGFEDFPKKDSEDGK